jgi:transcription initiation factor TFIIIB Brf1 subunit/transcription initiation factor TFIIB
MIRRQCPQCGKDWYSADTGKWVCETCGTVLDDKHKRPLLERRGGE